MNIRIICVLLYFRTSYSSLAFFSFNENESIDKRAVVELLKVCVLCGKNVFRLLTMKMRIKTEP